MPSLLYHRSGGKTAIRLARALGLTPTKIATDDLVVVRWGSSRATPHDQAINPIGAIKLAANGSQALRHLKDNDIYVPDVFTTPPEDEKLYPIFGRIHNHRAGLDIVVCETPEEARESDRTYFTRMVSVDMELGIHVFGSRVIKVFRKVPRRDKYHPFIRTTEFGWGYHRVALDRYPKSHRVAIATVEALGLTFGRVDLGWSRKESKYVVFEANTAPALNPHTKELYVERLTDYISRLGVTDVR